MAVEMTKTPAAIDVPWIVSVDDHVIEPPIVWVVAPAGTRSRRRSAGRAVAGGRAARCRVRATSSARAPTGRWSTTGSTRISTQSLKRAVTAAGRPRDDMTMTAHHLRRHAARLLRPGRAAARHGRELDRGVAVLPELPAFLRADVPRGERPRPRAALRRARTTTGWSRSGAAPAAVGWSRCASCRCGIATLAAAEVERNAARGVRAVCVPRDPCRTSGCRASTAASGIRSSPRARRPAPCCASTSAPAPRCRRRRPTRRSACTVTIGFGNCMNSLADWLVLGQARAVPRPAADVRRGPDRLDPVPARAGRRRLEAAPRRGSATGGEIAEPPSTYYYRQVYGCFFRDRHGLASLDACGVDNVMFEVDYPHSDSTWPDSRAVAAEIMAGLAPDVVHKLRCAGTRNIPACSGCTTCPSHPLREQS